MFGGLTQEAVGSRVSPGDVLHGQEHPQLGLLLPVPPGDPLALDQLVDGGLELDGLAVAARRRDRAREQDLAGDDVAGEGEVVGPALVDLVARVDRDEERLEFGAGEEVLHVALLDDPSPLPVISFRHQKSYTLIEGINDVYASDFEPILSLI